MNPTQTDLARDPGGELPLVSILIPAYNAAPFIADTLRSALAQTWPHKEIIVVDDGSKDETLAIAQQFAGAGIKVVTQENQGAAAARNALLALSRGEFIQWLDADDLLHPEKVASQMRVALRTPSRKTIYSAGWAYFIYRSRKAQFRPTALWNDLPPLEWLTRKMEQNLHMQTATWLTRREVLLAAGPWNTKLLGDDDGEYFARVLMASDQICFVPEAKVYYRISPTSRLSYIGRSQRKLEAQLLSMEMNIRYLRSLADTPRVRAACVTYLQCYLPNFYPEWPALVERARQMARELGGELKTPQPVWKYVVIQKMFGWSAAKRCQIWYNLRKAAVERWLDRTMYRWEARAVQNQAGGEGQRHG